MSERLVGAAVRRLEDDALVRGVGRFTDDLDLPDVLHVAFVRSPYSHAEINSIDVSSAACAPGIVAIYTLQDLAPHLTTDRLVGAMTSASIRLAADRAILARDEVVYVGEAVVVVIGTSRYVAEDAAELVEIDYSPLPSISDCRDALTEGAATVHRDLPNNLLAQFDFSYGDVAGAFDNAPHTFRESLWIHRGCGHSLEGRAVAARYDAVENLLTLWSSTQTPQATKKMLCDVLGREIDTVQVLTPDLGGGFGPKLVSYPEEVIVALAAELLRRPVKWIEDRREHFVATTQERDQYWDVEICVDPDGKVLGIRGDLLHDHGAYTARGINVPYASASNLPLSYNVPAYHMDIRVALTNKVPVAPVRGAGYPQAAFVMERLLDRVARELELSRDEVRRRNLVRPEQMPCRKPLKLRGGTDIVLDSGDYLAMQALALQKADWDSFPARQQAARADGQYRGIGLANFLKGTGRGPYEPVSVEISPTGTVLVTSGATAMGQSTATMLAQIVADELGVGLEQVKVRTGDTSAGGFGGFNSRQAVVAGTSAQVAAQAVREKALQAASHLLEVATHDLELASGQIKIAGVPEQSLDLGEIARALAGVPGFKLPGGLAPGLQATKSVVIDDMTFANGCAVAEVEVDTETGAVAIHRFVIAHDCGRAINPSLVEGQVVGGVAHGVGNALFEWMGFDSNAQPTTTTFADYLLVTVAQMPPVEVYHLGSPSPLNPLGVKGVGESGVVPAAAAIVSAVEDALTPFGVHLGQAPILPAALVELINAAREQP